MMGKKNLLAILLLFPLMFSACSKNNNLPHESDIVSLDVSGKLEHTQYWNKNDDWDFDGLFVCVNYLDGTSLNYSFLSKYVNFICEPNKPIDGVSALKIRNIYFIDYYGVFNLVTSEIEFPVVIINYPYDYAKIDLINLIIPIAVALASGLVVVFGVITFKTKKKKESL